MQHTSEDTCPILTIDDDLEEGHEKRTSQGIYRYVRTLIE